jgi:hypothetical protein
MEVEVKIDFIIIKYIIFFIYFIIRLISNILYFNCDQIKQGDFIIITIFIFTLISLKIETKNKDLYIVDRDGTKILNGKGLKYILNGPKNKEGL